MVRSAVVLLIVLSATPGAAAEADALHRLAFERLKRLEGRWIGTSTNGWTDTAELRVIAGGSVVMATSFDSHPNETMVTMFHLDGERLLLTHYCVARNQPRLVATEISEDGRRILFEWLDGTGLRSREDGHMDKALFEITGEDRYTSRWTWYQKGEERWMETIERMREAATP